ncbi:hypothetical protein NE237_026594 [Protea cynaroides]|uniref:Auxin-responsive protein n=1 Tax=Protea cynaroides TaxID=273540 RepID=A0A9Q0H6Z9_9MAGN|nr:hypothetical protein NE237_026594 [Protea cynaroides]
MDLELGLALPSNPIKHLYLNKYENKAQKRTFYDDHDDALQIAQTLPLLSWNDKPPNDEDDGDDPEDSSSSTINESFGEGNGIVGWPPIKRCRSNLHLRHHFHGHDHHQQQQNQAGQVQNDQRNEIRPNSMYVKVKMEGVAIGRKVDLSLHHSYQTLINTLIDMFGKYQEDKRGSYDAPYTLAYRDTDGDWLLVGDIPWQTFIRCVQCLMILRNGG